MAWLYIILAGICEIVWAYGLPIGTGYAVWSGIGAVGSVIVGMFCFNESKSMLKLLFILMIVIGIVGLKLVSN